jgi:hypothetical protein
VSEKIQDVLFAFLWWIDEHIVAWRLGVSVDWLRDRRARAEIFLARYEEPKWG